MPAWHSHEQKLSLWQQPVWNRKVAHTHPPGHLAACHDEVRDPFLPGGGSFDITHQIARNTLVSGPYFHHDVDMSSEGNEWSGNAIAVWAQRKLISAGWIVAVPPLEKFAVADERIACGSGGLAKVAAFKTIPIRLIGWRRAPWTNQRAYEGSDFRGDAEAASFDTAS